MFTVDKLYCTCRKREDELVVGEKPRLHLVAELCLLSSRGSGCRMPVWTWLTSLPPMVSYMSSARYGWEGVCAGNLLCSQEAVTSYFTRVRIRFHST